MLVRDLAAAMDQIAPLRDAEPWDNVGLILGDPAASARRVLLCIDLTLDVIDEARRLGRDAVVAYHPPLFKDVRKLVAGQPPFEALRAGLAVYTPHTALDVADGGTNDVLADVLGLADGVRSRVDPAGSRAAHSKATPDPFAVREPLKLSAGADDLKLVTFVPAGALEKVSAALFAAGAGRIGDYRECSFRVAGTGTFFGEEGTSPAVGEKGRREEVEELRLETVVPAGRVGEVVAALRAAHPYEEPAFDLLKRAAAPRAVGLGRIGDFDAPVSRQELIGRIKRGLGVDHVLVAGPREGMVKRAACCAGSCGDLLDLAASRGAEFYLTGELKHHDALRAARLGMTVVCVLHSNSERAALARLKDRLVGKLPGMEVSLSEADRDPFVVE
jgi:dinuclear metal center YbgI/SA1388 family protein